MNIQDNTEVLSKIESILTKILFTNYQLSVTVSDQNFSNSQDIIAYLQQLVSQLTNLSNVASEVENISIPEQLLLKIDENQNPNELIIPKVKQMVLMNQKSVGRQQVLQSICKE